MTRKEFRSELRRLVQGGWTPLLKDSGLILLQVPNGLGNGCEPLLSPLLAVSYAKTGVRTKASWIAAKKLDLCEEDLTPIVVASSDHVEISRWNKEQRDSFLSFRGDLFVDCEFVSQ